MVADYGRCVICTRAQNPPHKAGFGFKFFERDTLFPQELFDTAQEVSVKASKTRAQMFASLLS